jgi:hypothetical protein
VILNELLDDVNIYNQQPFKDFGPPFRYIMPDGAVDFNDIDTSNYKINATISVNSNFILVYHRSNNFTRSASMHFFIEINSFLQIEISLIPDNASNNAEVQKLEEIVDIVCHHF